MLRSHLLILSIIILLCSFALVDGSSAEQPIRTGQFTCYDEKGSLVECKDTGQDGDHQAGVIWPQPRFKDNGDGTVTDFLTGLMWLQDGNCLGRLSWQGALDIAGQSSQQDFDACPGYSAYSDWSLPEIGQLEKLFNAEEVSPSRWLNRKRFRNIQSGTYWSKTTGLNPYSAWILDFSTGEIVNGSKVDLRQTLLVRYPGINGVDVTDAEALLPGSRFTDNKDGTVTDNATGLMWLKNGSCLGKTSWLGALEQIKGLNNQSDDGPCKELSARFSDWALPNRNELRSLIDHRTDLPALPDNPFTHLKSYYWTSTTSASNPSLAYDLYLGSGELHRTDKRQTRIVWAVRPVNGRGERTRIEDMQEHSLVALADRYLLQTIGATVPIRWPVIRFTDNGDGTLTDNITGLMWLKDGDCFKPEKRKHAETVVNWLNTVPEKLKCVDYTATYSDWLLPDVAMMEELIRGFEGEPAAWLNDQGAVKVVPRDYWTEIENYWNLYHAWAFNLGQGSARNYPESFELHVWPARWPSLLEARMHESFLRGNGKSGEIKLEKGEELVLSAAVFHRGATAPAIFKISYEAPDGKIRWLSDQGEWLQDEVHAYQGNIFNLEDSPVFWADTAELATGVYNFFFVVSPDIHEDEGAFVAFDAALSVEVLAAEEEILE